jgi:CTP-dependent riboflavin kinase
MKDKTKESSIPPEIENPDNDVIHVHRIHFIINVTGRVVNKEYNKKLKRILFRLETEPDFTEGVTLSMKKVIFQFGLLKKLYRKYRKILYEGNNVSVIGFLVAMGMGESNDGVRLEEYVIDAQSIEEAKVEIPTIPEEVHMD